MTTEKGDKREIKPKIAPNGVPYYLTWSVSDNSRSSKSEPRIGRLPDLLSVTRFTRSDSLIFQDNSLWSMLRSVLNIVLRFFRFTNAYILKFRPRRINGMNFKSIGV